MNKDLQLKPIIIKDSIALTSILQKNKSIVNFLPFSVPNSNKETEFFIENLSPQTDKVWSIFFKQELIGLIGLHQIAEKRPEGKWLLKSAVLGYWLNPNFQRKGIGTKVVSIVLSYAFNELGLHKIKAQHIYENIASKGLLQKIGFRITGVMRQEAFFDNKWWDEVSYELLDSEWAYLTKR